MTPDAGSDQLLYDRGMATVISCWERFALATPAAAVVRGAGVAAAVFPLEPERGIYNNAVLERDLAGRALEVAIRAMEAAYAAAGVQHFAAWAHESDLRLIEALERRGYAFTESTRAMAMPLDGVRPEAADLEAREGSWDDYRRLLERTGLPARLLANVDGEAFDLSIVRLGGQDVATALSFDHDGDCGIYNVSTLAGARRQGIGTAVTARHLRRARQRGCSTASLQSSPMAERLYARLGFRDLGRILEFSPGRQRR